MRKNETAQALFFRTKEDFNIHSKLYYDIVLFCHSQKQRKKYEISLPFIIEGKIGQIGCKFMLVQNLDSKIKIFYKLVEFISTDYFTHIKSHVYKTIPSTFEYDYVIDLFYNGHNEVFIFSTFIYNNSISISDYDIHYEIMKRRNEFICNGIYIENKEHLKMCKSESNIKVNISILWNILLNMKTVHKYVKLLCQKIEYNSNTIFKGIKVELVFSNFIAKGIVTESRKIKGQAIIQINIYECITKHEIKENGKPFDNPLNKISIVLYGYKKQSTMHISFHFNKEQNNNKLLEFGNKLEIELLRFKNIAEHFSKNSNGDINKIENYV